MTLDFTPSGSYRITEPEPDHLPTSTDLARSYGLVGEWTARPGPGLLVDLLDAAHPTWWSRMVQPSFSRTWHASQVDVIPAVGGRTIWPDGRAAAVLVETPNRVGVLEDVEAAAAHGPLGVLVQPALAGDLTLPSATHAVMWDLGADTVSMAPGPQVPLEGPIARWAGVDRAARRALADTATFRARLLAKKLNQLRAVSCPLGPPGSGRLVVTTRRDAALVLGSMRERGVAGGVPVGLPEHPGGIAVTCRADHTDDALEAHVDAMAAALT